jgi:predicted NBD/HSP70 family sugar kinase
MAGDHQVDGAVRIGMDVGGTKTEGVVVDADGRILARLRRPTEWGPDAVIAGIVDVTRALAAEAGVAASAIVSVGVGVPGLVDADAGRVLHAVNLGVESLDIARLAGAELGVPVHVENDVKAAALGAAAVREDAGSMAYLNLGTGVAAGIVIGGRLWRGSRGTAGEVGHLPVDPHGRVCGCGQRGCIETLCGGGAVGRAWGRPGQYPVLDVYDAADAGDAEAVALRAGIARGAAAAVKALILAADVETVVIGGGLTALADRLRPDLLDALRADAAASPFLASLRLDERVELLPSGSPVAALGAALLGDSSAAVPATP